MGPPAAAFIDLDGTLLSVSSEKLFLGALHEKGMLSTGRFASFAVEYMAHPLRTISQGKGWNRSYLRGMDPVQVNELATEFGGHSLKKAIRPQVAEAVKALAGAGWTTILLTASIESLASAVVAGLPFQKVIGSVPEEAAGYLTGRIVGQRPWGSTKAEMARSICAEMEIGMKCSLAMGDSWADRMLLEKCGYAFVVSPDRKLRKLAHRLSWEIVEG